jgi:hypothetical protein
LTFLWCELTLDKQGKRNRRFWSREDDETLLDCEAIISARTSASSTAKRTRAAFEQVLGTGSASKWRLRLQRLLEHPSRPAYLAKLTDTWMSIWTQYRGTPELPDDNQESNTEFDLRAHLAFLREKIDKHAV